MLLNRDLRVHDQPALSSAASAGPVVPLFVVDERLGRSGLVGPNRARFLSRCLSDLRNSLRSRGGELFIRRGDPAAVAVRVAAEVGARAVFASRDVGPLAQARQADLSRQAGADGLAFRTFPGTSIVEPDALSPSGGGHYRVFTPYWRAWQAEPRRPLAPRLVRLRVPTGLACGRLPSPGELSGSSPLSPSPAVIEGGETAARAAMVAWVRSRSASYGEGHDDLAGDRTSHLSAYLHFGCLSPAELEDQVRREPKAESFIRQLAWRDFHHQVTLAFPEINRKDYRPRARRWRHEDDALDAWKKGVTGYPIVDAGMRQLRAEGWMHNRTRLITASFLTKTMGLDWRVGARHFMQWLVDADVANNYGNWQWVAGTGNDTRPNRVLNPIRQAERFDPEGNYVRRYVPELAAVEGKAVHQPWKLSPWERAALTYPERIADHTEPAARA